MEYVSHPGSPQEFRHIAVDRAVGEYVRGIVPTNTIEGYRSQLKLQVFFSYHWVRGKHLSRYASEMS